MGKPQVQPRLPRVYREEPDCDGAASTSAVALLDDVDYPDEEPPSYTDEPSAMEVPIPSGQYPAAPTSGMNWYSPPPDLPFSTHDIDNTEIRTRFPNFSTDAKSLLSMIRDQVKYPPGYYVELHGSHSETIRNGNKETKNKVIDFYIRINISNLLSNGINSGDETTELLPGNKRGYRGGRLPGFNPTVISDVENQTNELKSWCEAYVNNPASVKAFTLKREIVNHDTKKLEQLLRSGIAEIQYRGHLHIKFPMQYKRVVVYSPGKINEWRITTWIRWVFYLTFLWIFAWPILFFLTHKYEVVKAVYSYANVPTDDGGNRQCRIMDEHTWYEMWAPAIQRAAVTRMECKDRCLDDNYRIATAKANARGLVQSLAPRQAPQTGNALTGGALGFLMEGLSVAEGWNTRRGWGADS